jgi:hypothetical protein
MLFGCSTVVFCIVVHTQIGEFPHFEFEGDYYHIVLQNLLFIIWYSELDNPSESDNPSEPANPSDSDKSSELYGYHGHFQFGLSFDFDYDDGRCV